MNRVRLLSFIVASMTLVACGKTADSHAPSSGGESRTKIQEVLHESYVAKGQAGLERLEQDYMQAACSGRVGMALDGIQSGEIIKAAKARIVYPSDGNYLGDWERGEEIAQRGKGMQYSDDPDEPNGGNCYACHELSVNEIAYGNMGPSLKHYGKLRGNAEQILKYTWERIYDSHAYVPCTHMPAFGTKKILTEQQMKDVMALLFDPESPVNQ